MHEGDAEERRSHPWEDDLDGGDDSFGGWLRQQREIRGISLREIADASKISIRYLEALETGRFSMLPAPVFAKGFLRQYATIARRAAGTTYVYVCCIRLLAKQLWVCV